MTELACCFRKLNATEMRKFKASSAQLYERSIQGIIHLRSDGRRLVLGTVYGRPGGDGLTNGAWKWDWWEAREAR